MCVKCVCVTCVAVFIGDFCFSIFWSGVEVSGLSGENDVSEAFNGGTSVWSFSGSEEVGLQL